MNYDIGIIGGAGPQAGALFIEKIIQWFQREKGAWQDKDFPSIQLFSFPFSDMLSIKENQNVISQELENVFKELSARYFAIACNTLHSYCGEWAEHEGFVSMLKVTAERVKQEDAPPLMLCTATSRKYGIHQNQFPCSYPSDDVQIEVDEIIEIILRGLHTIETAHAISNISKKNCSDTQSVILGCTELSVLFHDYPEIDFPLIDPCDLVIEKLCQSL